MYTQLVFLFLTPTENWTSEPNSHIVYNVPQPATTVEFCLHIDDLILSIY